MADFLRKIGEIAQREGLTIGVENNNRTETNMMNHLPDIQRMVDLVGLPNIGIHCDYYHLHFAEDDPDILRNYPGKIVHTHIAKVERRAYVTDLEGETPYIYRYSDALRAIGYEGGMSLEAMPDPGKRWEILGRRYFHFLYLLFTKYPPYVKVLTYYFC